uniref:Viral protein 80 kDa n=1 Tax=Lymantria dispar multicapsid nuclear polyhedrosis virus TaxID=10449 RepID=A0A1B1MQX2_NPVLD|nr:viral protein 80 kDa [Lymantria dispar multiple nucleopolyhedrovirus]
MDVEHLYVEGKQRPFRLVHMLPDGSCFFRAISYVVHGTQERHAHVRREVCEYIVDNWQDYEHYTFKKTDSYEGVYPTKEEYFEQMNKCSTFGSLTELTAAAKIYNRNFIIYVNGMHYQTIVADEDATIAAEAATHCLKFSGDKASGHLDVYEPVRDVVEFSRATAVDHVYDMLNKIQMLYYLIMSIHIMSIKPSELEFFKTVNKKINNLTLSTNIQRKVATYSEVIDKMNRKYHAIHRTEPLWSSDARNVDTSMNIDSVTIVPPPVNDTYPTDVPMELAPVLNSTAATPSNNCKFIYFFVSQPAVGQSSLEADIDELLDLNTISDISRANLLSLKDFTQRPLDPIKKVLAMTLDFNDYASHLKMQQFMFKHADVRYKKILSRKLLQTINYLRNNPKIVMQQSESVRNILLSVLLTYRQSCKFKCFLTDQELEQVTDQNVLFILNQYIKLKFVINTTAVKKAPARTLSVDTVVKAAEQVLSLPPPPPPLSPPPLSLPETDTALPMSTTPPLPETDTALPIVVAMDVDDEESGGDGSKQKAQSRRRRRRRISSSNLIRNAADGDKNDDNDDDDYRGDDDDDDDDFNPKRNRGMVHDFFDLSAESGPGTRTPSPTPSEERPISNASSEAQSSLNPDGIVHITEPENENEQREAPAQATLPIAENEERNAAAAAVATPPIVENEERGAAAEAEVSLPRYSPSPIVDWESDVELPPSPERRQTPLQPFDVETMPFYFQRLLIAIPDDPEQSYLTCPTNNLDVIPTRYNFVQTIKHLAGLDLSQLDYRVHFYEMLSPLTLYGATSVDESQALWFINKTYNYFALCLNRFDEIRQSMEANASNRLVIFIIKYNFLWHYAQFIRTLKSTALTAHHNRKILNALRIYSNNIETKYSFRFDSQPAGVATSRFVPIVKNRLVELMVGL